MVLHHLIIYTQTRSLPPSFQGDFLRTRLHYTHLRHAIIIVISALFFLASTYPAGRSRVVGCIWAKGQGMVTYKGDARKIQTHTVYEMSMAMGEEGKAGVYCSHIFIVACTDHGLFVTLRSACWIPRSHTYQLLTKNKFIWFNMVSQIPL